MRYRFRLINNGILDCPITVSIDNHTLLVIASDGNSVQPVEGIICMIRFSGDYVKNVRPCFDLNRIVDSLIMTSGERFDFVLKADQEASSFWIRFRGNMDWNSKHVFQTAILRYQNEPDVEPSAIISYETTNRIGTV